MWMDVGLGRVRWGLRLIWTGNWWSKALDHTKSQIDLHIMCIRWYKNGGLVLHSIADGGGRRVRMVGACTDVE